MWPNRPKTEPPSVLAPGATIGILGGGQLGRMLALAAARLGFRCHVYSAEADAPACDVAAQATRADYRDEAALARFAHAVEVVTPEFENVPAETAEFLASLKPVRPAPLALAIAQDRLVEKEFAQRLGIRTARFAGIGAESELSAACSATGLPAILKTRRLGYDGKGQISIARAEEAGPAVARLKGQDLILEERVAFEREISVILARDLLGNLAVYDIPENVHREGILVRSTVPARLPPGIEGEAVAAARRLAEALDYVGVLAVELFVTPAGILFNEFAPRVHNSGHWTEDACATGQFEQHIRAIAGWPLGAPARHADAVMENLIGEDARRWRELAGEPGTQLHLYGKSEIRAGRKMGHITRLSALRR